MNIPPTSVVVYHPGNQFYNYQVALAFQRAGLLRQYITGIYYTPDKFPYTFVRCLPSSVMQRVLRELNKRRLSTLDDRLITSVPYFESISRIIGRLPLLLRITEGRSGYLFANWAGDLYVRWWLSRCTPFPKILYCFLGSALLSFRYAKRIGVRTVLDVPWRLDTPRLIAKERHRLGLPVRYTDIEPRLRAEVLEADYIIAPSEAVVRSITALGVPSERVILIPFGVDVSSFKASSRSSPRADGKFRVLFVGKLDLRKGIHYLLEAWHALALPEAELVIVGRPAGDPDFFRSMCIRYGNSFIERGNVPHNELPGLYAQADIFVFPSLAEGSALVTYEALASGLPCIVTPEAGSVVRDGVEGFVIPVGDVEILTKCIQRLHDNPVMRQRMAIAARRRAEAFTWEIYGEHLVKSINMMFAITHF